MFFNTFRNLGFPCAGTSSAIGSGLRLSAKTYRVMRFTAFFLFAFSMHICASGVSQQISYRARQVALEKLFPVIKQQTGYLVLYNPDLLAAKPLVSVDASNMPLKSFLDQAFKGTGLTYFIENKTIFIKKGALTENPDADAAKELPLVKGTITTHEGQPLASVSIRVKGTDKGTLTNEQGSFSLKNVPENGTLVISSIGYESIEIPVSRAMGGVKGGTRGLMYAAVEDNQLNIVVCLTQSAVLFDDVSVTSDGFRTMPLERTTGASSKVTNEQLNAHLNTNLAAALEGKVAGLSFYKNSLQLRGTATFSTLNVGTAPLLVIDGLPTEGDISQINPYDIESVTVLKDAAASSIYGARSANGVIVITTKQASKGKTIISFNVDRFITERPDLSKMHYASTSDLIDYETAVYNRELRRTGSATALFNAYGNFRNGTIRYYSPLYALFRKEAAGQMTKTELDATINSWRNNDYMQEYHDEVWQNEVRQRYNVSLSSGSEKASTYFSLNFDQNDARIKYNTSENLNLYLKSSFHSKKAFTATFGVNTQYSKYVSTATDLNDYSIQERYARILDENGNKVYSPYVNLSDGFSSGGGMNSAVADTILAKSVLKPVYFNVLDELQNGRTTTKGLNIRAFADFNVKLPLGFKYNLKFQVERESAQQENYIGPDAYKMRYLHNVMTSYDATANRYTNNVPNGGRYYQFATSRSNYTFRNQLDYDRNFDIGGRSNEFSALAAFEMRESFVPRANGELRYGYDPVTLTSQLIDWERLSQTGVSSYLYNGNKTISYLPGRVQTETKHRFVSVMGNFGYTFDGRFSLTGSFRIDQADLFGTDPKYRYRPMWSTGLAWNASKDPMLNNIDWLSYLKVRMTYGVNGNVDQTSSALITAALRNDNLFPALQYLVPTLPNPKLRWEKSETVNTGFDFGLWKNKLTGSLELYYKYSSDLLTQMDLDPTVGATSQTVNNGAMSNRGVELSLRSTWFEKGKWALSSSVTAAYNKNKIERVDRLINQAFNFISAPSNYFEVSTPYNTVYAYRFLEMVNGYPTFLNEKDASNVTFNTEGNIATVAQITSPDAIVKLGSLIPVWNGAFQQSARYGNLQLSALFAFYAGHKLRRDVPSISGFTQNTTHINDRYTSTNTNTSMPRLELDYPDIAASSSHASTLSTLYRYADVHVADASSVRLRNISLSYVLPAGYSGLLRTNSVKITAQVNNLWLWSAAGDDIDPETYSLNSGTRSLPTPKSFLVGVQIGF